MAVRWRAVPSMTGHADNDSTGRGNPPVPTDHEFLTVGDVAERLRVHPQTVRAWIARGDLPAIKIGRTVRITQRDFQQMLERARIPLTTRPIVVSGIDDSERPHPDPRALLAR